MHIVDLICVFVVLSGLLFRTNHLQVVQEEREEKNSTTRLAGMVDSTGIFFFPFRYPSIAP
jgi:cell division protein FtsI/penicillin-binding protein 2